MVKAIQRLDHKMFESVCGNEGLCSGREALDDKEQDGDLDGIPGKDRIWVLSPGPAVLVYKS